MADSICYEHPTQEDGPGNVAGYGEKGKGAAGADDGDDGDDGDDSGVGDVRDDHDDGGVGEVGDCEDGGDGRDGGDCDGDEWSRQRVLTLSEAGTAREEGIGRS
ncbi:MAG: hypothetical protein LQ337_003878 [Flavoplaca oasis]|nr:MAG: hypothetical protein LQ337_003878 [Flavoplaca oasis]